MQRKPPSDLLRAYLLNPSLEINPGAKMIFLSYIKVLNSLSLTTEQLQGIILILQDRHFFFTSKENNQMGHESYFEVSENV